MKKILLTTNTFKRYHRQDLAVKKIQALKEKNQNVDIKLIQFKNEEEYYPELSNEKVLDRSSSTVLNTKKQFPFVNDLFNVSADLSEDIFVFFNSDVILTQKLINYINENDIEALGISRIEITNLQDLSQQSHIIRMEPAGFDAWVVSKKWWYNHKQLFEDMLLGRPEFDIIYTSLMLLNSKNIHISTDYLIYHIQHQTDSFTRDEAYQFNIDQRDKHYKDLINWWGSICNNTYYKRKDFGRFLNFLQNEKVIIENLKIEGLKSNLLKQHII